MPHLSRQFFSFSKLGSPSLFLYNYNIYAFCWRMSRASVSEFILALTSNAHTSFCFPVCYDRPAAFRRGRGLGRAQGFIRLPEAAYNPRSNTLRCFVIQRLVRPPVVIILHIFPCNLPELMSCFAIFKIKLFPFVGSEETLYRWLSMLFLCHP